MDDEDIIVFNHDEFLWFWYESCGEKPFLKLENENESKELSELQKQLPKMVNELQKQAVRAKLNRLA